jgi:hypothetical protein
MVFEFTGEAESIEGARRHGDMNAHRYDSNEERLAQE